MNKLLAILLVGLFLSPALVQAMAGIPVEGRPGIIPPHQTPPSNAADPIVVLFNEHKDSLEATVKSNLNTLKYGLPIAISIEIDETDPAAQSRTGEFKYYALRLDSAGNAALAEAKVDGDLSIKTTRNFLNAYPETNVAPNVLMSNNEEFTIEGQSLKGKLIKEFIEKQYDITFYVPAQESKGFWGDIRNAFTNVVAGIFHRLFGLFK